VSYNPSSTRRTLKDPALPIRPEARAAGLQPNRPCAGTAVLKKTCVVPPPVCSSTPKRLPKHIGTARGSATSHRLSRSGWAAYPHIAPTLYVAAFVRGDQRRTRSKVPLQGSSLPQRGCHQVSAQPLLRDMPRCTQRVVRSRRALRFVRLVRAGCTWRVVDREIVSTRHTTYMQPIGALKNNPAVAEAATAMATATDENDHPNQPRTRTAEEPVKVLATPAPVKAEREQQLADVASVRVLLRVRPTSVCDLRLGYTSHAIECADDGQRVLVPAGGGMRTFNFDRVLPPSAGQEELFDSMTDMVDGFLEGYNSTVFAYGQTGSGKTYTMGTRYVGGLKGSFHLPCEATKSTLSLREHPPTALSRWCGERGVTR
jgi:hypothetical protein